VAPLNSKLLQASVENHP